MKMKLQVLFAAGVVMTVLCGCKSSPQPPLPAQYTHVPVYVAASAIPPDSQEKIISNPQVRAYAIGRYIDPYRRTVMHEQHSIYRVEQSPYFNLMPQPDADPVLRAQREKQERYADAIAGQMARTAEEMRRTRVMMDDLIKNQAAQMERSGNVAGSIDELKRQYGILSDNLLKSSQHFSRLEAELKRLKGEAEVMKFQIKANKKEQIR